MATASEATSNETDLIDAITAEVSNSCEQHMLMAKDSQGVTDETEKARKARAQPARGVRQHHEAQWVEGLFEMGSPRKLRCRETG